MKVFPVEKSSEEEAYAGSVQEGGKRGSETCIEILEVFGDLLSHEKVFSINM